MPGTLWGIRSGATAAEILTGDQAGLDAAKAAYTAAGGLLQIGPGLEALVLGNTGWANIALARILSTGIMALSRLAAADGTDPTKLFRFDPSAIATGITRVGQLPNWDGLFPLPADAGISGRFLKSLGAGVQPVWDVVPSPVNALLDGVNHSDTLAGAVVAGDLIHGNATPKWARLPIGAAGQVLAVVGGLPAWTSVPSALQHDILLHIRAIRATNVSINNGSTTLTTTGNQFAGVRIGDFVSIDLGGVDLAGSYVTALIDSNNVTLSRTKTTAGNISGAVAVITPGDHFDRTLAEANGYLVGQGNGTYEPTANSAGTFQEMRGPMRWRGYVNGAISTDFRVDGSPSAVQPTGFMIASAGGPNGVRFYAGLLTAARLYTLPDANDTICLIGTAQTLDAKDLNLGNKIRMDGTSTYSLFRTPGGADRLGFDMSAMTALRSVSWPDYAGRARVEGAPVTFANGDTTPSVSASRVFLTNNAGATTITTFDDAVDGQEITVIFGDNNTTIQNGANMKTAGGLNIVGTTDDVVRFVKAGANWYQASPVSVNA